MKPDVETVAGILGGPRVPAAGSRQRAAVSSYDFRRPIQLSREHTRILQVAFEGYARQATNVFTSGLRRICMVRLASVEQRSYAEYVDSLPTSTYLTMFSADPVAGRGILEIPLGTIMTCLDHMLGGPGGPDQPLRPLTEIESGVVSGFVARLLAEMHGSLDGMVSIDAQVVGTEYNPQFAQVASAVDIVVVLTFEVEIDKVVAPLTLCLPFTGLLPHVVAAAAPAPVSDRERTLRAESGRLMRLQFESVPVDIAIRFRTTTISPDALAGLAVGDVVRLGHPASAPLEVRADETTFAFATAGSRKARLAALIVGTNEETR